MSDSESVHTTEELLQILKDARAKQAGIPDQLAKVDEGIARLEKLANRAAASVR